MAIRIISPTNSFVRFSEACSTTDCNFGSVEFNLPVADSEDVSFQWVIETDTEEEADALCTQDGSGIEVSLVDDCAYGAGLIDFTELPERFRLSTTQILFNWQHGFPGFPGPILPEQCFKIRVTVDGVQFCSNCFQRVIETCYTSVLEYGNDEDAFGFKYCAGGAVPSGGDTPVSCEPTEVSFVNVPTLTIPYTAMLQDQYGTIPTIQVWIFDEMGQLVNMSTQVKFDAYPPTQLLFDFGGPASGKIVIR